MSRVCRVVLPLLIALAAGLGAPATARCSEQLVAINGSQLWADLQGNGPLNGDIRIREWQ